MNKEQLKALLDAGNITQEEYDTKIKELGDEGDDKGGDEKKDEFNLDELLKDPAFQKVIQSEVDKVRTKYSSEKKDLEKELNELRTKNMSKEEILEEKERSLKEFEAKVKRQELDFETYKLLSEKKVDNKFFDFVKGDTVEERKESLDKLIGILDEQSSQKAEQKFKSQGREFKESGESGDDKKWEEMTIDERIAFAETNPNEAKQYLGN